MMSTSYKKLERQDGIISGVCGGLGAFFDVSPWWFRILFILLAMPGGLPGVLPYVVMWLVVPKKKEIAS